MRSNNEYRNRACGRITGIGRPEPTEAGRMMPALRIRGFNFESLSDAV
jgi:hypothetical protein